MSLRLSGVPMTSSPAAPLIDGIWRSSFDSAGDLDGTLQSRRHSPILVRHGDPTSFTVRVRGDPAPSVTWYVGRKPLSATGSADLSGDGRFRLESDWKTGRHTLRVSGCATDDLDEGLWVVAGNEVGQDCTAIKVKTYRVLSRVSDGTQLASESLPRNFRLRRKKSSDGRPLKSSSATHASLTRELDPARRRHKRPTGDQPQSPYHSSESGRPHSSFYASSHACSSNENFSTKEQSTSETSLLTCGRPHPARHLPSDWQDIPGRATPESLGPTSDSVNDSAANSPRLSTNERPRRRVTRRKQLQQQPQQQQQQHNQVPSPSLQQQQRQQLQQPLSNIEVPPAVDGSPMAEKYAAVLKNGTKKKKKKKRKKENEDDDNKENNEEAVTVSSVDNDSSGRLPTKNRIKRPSRTSTTTDGDRVDDDLNRNDVELMITKVDETDSFRRIEQWRMKSGDHFRSHDDEGVRCDPMAVDEADAKDHNWNDSLWKLDGCDVRLSTFCAGLLGSMVVNDNGDDIMSPISLLSPPMTDNEGLESLSTPTGGHLYVPGVSSRRSGSWKRTRADRTRSNGGADSALGDSMLSNDDLSSTTTEPAVLSTSMLLPPPSSYTVSPSCASRQHSWPDSSDWWRDEQIPNVSEVVDPETQGWVSPCVAESTAADSSFYRAPSSCPGDDERTATNDDDDDVETSSGKLCPTMKINCGEQTTDDDLNTNVDSESETIPRRTLASTTMGSGEDDQDEPPQLDESTVECDSAPPIDPESLVSDGMPAEHRELPSAHSEVSDDDLSTSCESSTSSTGSFTVTPNTRAPASAATAAATAFGRPSSPSTAQFVAPSTQLYIVDIDISDVDSGRGATSVSSTDGDNRRGRNVGRRARCDKATPKSDVCDTAMSRSTENLPCRESVSPVGGQYDPVTDGHRRLSGGGRTVAPSVDSVVAGGSRRVLSKSVELLVSTKRPRSVSRTRQRMLSRERLEKVTTTIRTETTIFVPPIQRSSSLGNIGDDGRGRLSTCFVADIECDAASQSSSLSDEVDDVTLTEDTVSAPSQPVDNTMEMASEPETGSAVDDPEDEFFIAKSSPVCETDFPYFIESSDSFIEVPDEAFADSYPSEVISEFMSDKTDRQVTPPQSDVSDTGHSTIIKDDPEVALAALNDDCSTSVVMDGREVQEGSEDDLEEIMSDSQRPKLDSTVGTTHDSGEAVDVSDEHDSRSDKLSRDNSIVTVAEILLDEEEEEEEEIIDFKRESSVFENQTLSDDDAGGPSDVKDGDSKLELNDDIYVPVPDPSVDDNDQRLNMVDGIDDDLKDSLISDDACRYDSDPDDDDKEHAICGDSWWMKTTTKTTTTICQSDPTIPCEYVEPLPNSDTVSEAQQVVDFDDGTIQMPSERKQICVPIDNVDDFPAVPRSPRGDVADPTNDWSLPSSRKSSVSYSIQSIVVGSSVSGSPKTAMISRGISMEPAELDDVCDLSDNVKPTAELDDITPCHEPETIASSTNADDGKQVGRPSSPMTLTSTVVHEYGEMFTIFGRLPPFIEALKLAVARQHEVDPQICRLLARYPSLRPGTWQWTVLPRIADLRRQMLGPEADRQSEAEDASSTSGATKVTMIVVDGKSYIIEPVVERFVNISDGKF